VKVYLLGINSYPFPKFKVANCPIPRVGKPTLRVGNPTLRVRKSDAKGITSYTFGVGKSYLL